jgi:hypothetical protein
MKYSVGGSTKSKRSKLLRVLETSGFTALETSTGEISLFIRKDDLFAAENLIKQFGGHINERVLEMPSNLAEFELLKLMALIISLGAIAIALLDNTELTNLSTKIIFSLIGIGLPWLACACAKCLVRKK